MDFGLIVYPMDIQTICKKIYNLTLGYAGKLNAPVAYINVEVGSNFAYEDNQLWEAFNKIRWDTVLSSAELFIVRKTFSGVSDDSLRVVSITVFEDDSGNSPVIPVVDGLIV
ncbi:MAG: hypothetical protein K5930_09720 [Treponemataceae bacterium]|nr:hypothetical protein [Treponemataceae bacterium]